MNRERTRSGKPPSAIHTLVAAEPERARPSGRVLLLMSVAVVAGVAVALIWLYQHPRGRLEMLVAQATASAAAPTSTVPVTAATDVAVAGATLPANPDVTGPDVAESDVVEANIPDAGVAHTNLGVVVASGNGAGTHLAQQSRAAQQSSYTPPPTPTSTPQPPLDSVEAVIGVGGVTLWDASSGQMVGEGEQGALFTATARSDDGEWLQGALEDGTSGWARRDQLIVFDADRLRSQPVVIMPITPTPAAPAGAPTSAGAAPTAAAGDAGDEVPVLRPTPAPGEVPTARVALDDGRLNLRAGPGSDYSIIAKALPGEEFAVLGRDATRQWLQLALPDMVGGFAWASVEFLATTDAIGDLPVTDEVSSAPVYQEGAHPSGGSGDTTKGGLPAPAQTAYPREEGTQPRTPVASSQQPATASVTGLSGKLVIQTTWGGDIYIYDLQTGELRLLTGGFDPALSPDGTQVAFTRLGGEHGLYLINVDGSNEHMIFSERAHFLAPKWSPDGKYIVFERGDEFINCTLFPLDNPDPSGNCLVNREPENWEEMQQKLARVDVNGNNYQDIPVLTRSRAPDWNSAGIVYMSPAGIQKTQDIPGAQTELVYFNIKKQYELDPDWQPNGGRIVFQRRENDHWEIWSVAPDGSGLTALTYPSFTLVDKLPSNVAPAWSPDGQHIVYLSNRQPNQSAGEWRVWVMDADGGNQHPLDIDLSFTYTFVAEQMLDWGR